MNEQKPRASLVVLGASFLFFPLVLCGIALVLYGHVTNGAFVRFGNSLLTSYTLASFVLLFSLFVYGDKRKRPVAPLLGMLGAALSGFTRQDLWFDASRTRVLPGVHQEAVDAELAKRASKERTKRAKEAAKEAAKGDA